MRSATTAAATTAPRGRASTPRTQANTNISAAMIRWIGRPSGKPAVAAEIRCPSAPTMPPSSGEKATAARYPGAASRATVPVGLGILMNAPTPDSATRIATRATRRGEKNPFEPEVDRVGCSLMGPSS